MNTLCQALSAAIKVANQPNADNFDAVALTIYEDSTFEIGQRTYSNVSFSGKLALSPNEKDHYTLTVPKNAYPAWDKWPFMLLEFCAYYGIKISNYEVRDILGTYRPRIFEKAN